MNNENSPELETKDAEIINGPCSQHLSKEDEAYYKEAYGNQPRIEDAQRCRLPASGITETLDSVYDWAKILVSRLRPNVDGQKVSASLWAYREQSSEWLALDFSGGRVDERITFLIGEPHNFYADFDGGTVNVPDMTEALYMAGILCDALDAQVVDFGKRGNEVNAYCTPNHLVPGHHSARLEVPTEQTLERAK